ncbi:MAG: hypothetical protein JKX68_06635 [Flavobacteriales bacterium]|nr:hypothetical protein [Flavobacteriales bacterium]
MRKLVSNTKLWLVASLTLGLAPFRPEPHIWSKLKWILGGAVGMHPMDWFDVLLHGAPWCFLIIALVLNVKKLLTNSNIQ